MVRRRKKEGKGDKIKLREGKRDLRGDTMALRAFFRVRHGEGTKQPRQDNTRTPPPPPPPSTPLQGNHDPQHH